MKMPTKLVLRIKPFLAKTGQEESTRQRRKKPEEAKRNPKLLANKIY